LRRPVVGKRTLKMLNIHLGPKISIVVRCIGGGQLLARHTKKR
jgi:hypothetical protein